VTVARNNFRDGQAGKSPGNGRPPGRASRRGDALRRKGVCVVAKVVDTRCSRTPCINSLTTQKSATCLRAIDGKTLAIRDHEAYVVRPLALQDAARRFSLRLGEDDHETGKKGNGRQGGFVPIPEAGCDDSRLGASGSSVPPLIVRKERKLGSANRRG